MSERATVVQIAKQFHDAHERMAPFFGYSTRLDTWSEASPNGQLMQATIREVVMPLIDAERQRADAAERKLEQARTALTAIDAWELPRVACEMLSGRYCPKTPHVHSFEVEFGSNGARDYIRRIAHETLAAIANEEPRT